ncbi:MAG: asparaginase domain-containing protein [Candidatus Binatia bacterium]
MAEPARKRKLLLVSIGGTISLEKDPHTGRSVPRLSAVELIEQTSLADSCEVRCIDAPVSLRTIRRPADLLATVSFLQRHLQEDIAGVVVTHGTDTLEEVAYFFDEIFASRVPLVFTGAMRPGWTLDYDGIRNLENAMRIAAVATAEYGVLVTMHDEIFEAWSVYKADTTALDGFTARRGAATGHIINQTIELPWRSAPRSRFGILPQTLPTSVPILTMGIGDDGAVLDRIAAGSIQGLVIAGMGAGSIPSSAQEKVLTLTQQGIPIVLCSSASSGPTAAEQYYPGDYDELRAAGIVIENQLNARKARMRLLLSIGLGTLYLPFGF